MSGCCKEIEKDKIVVGIDFGTTNCLISYLDENNKIQFVRQSRSSTNLIPSEIAFNKDGCLFANSLCSKGCSLAINSGMNYKLIRSIKRIIGLDLQEVLDLKDFLPFEVSSDPTDEKRVLINCGNNIFKTVDDIVLEMMIQLKLIILMHFVGDKKQIHAVITVPAYFDEKARNVIKKNASLAGIIVIRLINEPTAAAIAYENSSGALQDNKSYIVYDLGGGTFDISIIKKYKDNFFRVLGIGGDKFLGGDDLDRAVFDYFADKNPISLSDAKRIKENYRETFSKNEFAEICKPVLEKSFAILEKVINETTSKFQDLEIEGVILVGGSARLDLIKDYLSQKFKIFDDLNPDEIVAYGAGLHAHEIMYKSNNHKLLDAIGMSFGLETAADGVEILIPKNSPVPISKTQVFTNQVDNQEAMRIAICQGEAKKFSENIMLGKFSLTNLPKAPAYFLQIEVTFSVDMDGILSVTAHEISTNNGLFVTFSD